MNCKQAREELLLGNASPNADAHVRECAECAAVLVELRQTMALLDTWQAPEVSPYFAARMRSRIRAEAERPQSIREWLAAALSPFTNVGRRVALGATMAVLVGAGVTLYQGSPAHPLQSMYAVERSAKPGTAVADLQALDKNHDLFENFDLLDDVNP